MKKTVLTLATAFTVLFATACNNDAANKETEMAHDEALAHDEMMHEDGMDHQDMGNMSAEGTAVQVAQFEQVPADAKAQVQQLTNYYLEIKNALVAGKATEAQAAATKMVAPLEQFNAASLPADQQEFYKQQAQSLKDAAMAIKNSSDIEAQRKQLGQLTDSVYALNKAFDANEKELYRQYCPMANNNKGGYWLSAEKQVLNPYFGDKMLKCGRVAETLQ